MPLLKGKSSHGSKPMTWLSFTLNWMPHCWPQKQQCVFTSRSGSALVDRRAPVGADRCGPYRSMMRSSSTGIVAISLLLDCGKPLGLAAGLPGAALGEPEERAPAARADLLIVFRPLR